MSIHPGDKYVLGIELAATDGIEEVSADAIFDAPRLLQGYRSLLAEPCLAHFPVSAPPNLFVISRGACSTATLARGVLQSSEPADLWDQPSASEIVARIFREPIDEPEIARDWLRIDGQLDDIFPSSDSLVAWLKTKNRDADAARVAAIQALWNRDPDSEDLPFSPSVDLRSLEFVRATRGERQEAHPEGGILGLEVASAGPWEHPMCASVILGSDQHALLEEQLRARGIEEAAYYLTYEYS